MQSPAPEVRPVGFTAVGVFFLFGATMAAYAAFTLLKPGTVLDRAWALNPAAHLKLGALGPKIGVPFVALAIALLLAGIGWFQRRYWGWLLGSSLVAVNLVGDLVQMVRGERLRGAVGVAVAGLLLFYLTGRRVRGHFARD